jgi:hypothetical protein
MLPLPVTTDDVPLNNKFKVVVDKYLDIPAGIYIPLLIDSNDILC